MIWNETIECMNREEMRKLQSIRLRRVVEHAYHNSPFYRKKMQEMGITPEDIHSIDDIVKLDHVLDGSLRYSRDKGSLFFFQILILIEHGTDHKMAVTALFCHFHQDPADQFSRIDRISHGLFLQTTVPDAVTVK